MDYSTFFHVYSILRFDKVTYLSLFFNSFLPEGSRNSLWVSGPLLFPGFINIEWFLFCNFIEFIILLHTFLTISFSLYKEYMTCLISFSKSSDVLPALLAQELLVTFEAFV